jgi:2-polyprenyl-3-methyl-5-hydroxy-6-metoxy-1,4-benzoquinol methylase
MFKFNFFETSDESTAAAGNQKNEGSHNQITEINNQPKAVEHHVPPSDVDSICQICNGCQLLSQHNMKYRKLDDIKETELSELLTQTESQCSDLIPGLYEGGMKIWECTHDMLDYMENIDLRGKRILDLGCGCGLLGIKGLLMGASEVHFQDFNKEVIEDYTIRNVSLNNLDVNKCRFISGDWDDVSSYLSGQGLKYDVIMTSETIYNPRHHSKLLNVFRSLLDVNGFGLIGAKSHYFGVGGTAAGFIDSIEGHLDHMIIRHIPAAVSRLIIHVKKPVINDKCDNSIEK